MHFSLTTTFTLAAIFSFVDARFGQEQLASQKIQTLGNLKVANGDQGFIPTLAGQSIGTLLAAADPCAFPKLMDTGIDFVKKLADPADTARGIQVIQDAMRSEKNFNPFVTDKASVCLDPAIPVNQEIRGIVPLVDPALAGADQANANNDRTSGDGSIADQLVNERNFNLITGANPVVNTGAQPGANPVVNAGANPGANTGGNAGNNTGNGGNADDLGGGSAIRGICQNNNQNDQNNNDDEGNSVNDSVNSVNGEGGAGSAIPGIGQDQIDATRNVGNGFGTCTAVPAMKFQAGLNAGNPAELRFQVLDEVAFPGQSTALNPAIIMNFLCDRLRECRATDAEVKCRNQLDKQKASNGRTGVVVDDWNAEFGITSNFASIV